jgi:hypothetical protein
MINKRLLIVPILLFSLFTKCEHDSGSFSGSYCLNIQNMVMTIEQTGTDVIFSIGSGILTNGSGTVAGDTLLLNGSMSSSELFTARLLFSDDRKNFAGPFSITNQDGDITFGGILQGKKGECEKYDIAANGIPKFVEKDFTQLSKIEKISKFRSGFGHSYNDSFESCRSMKHYYNPYPEFRQNNTVEIYSPVSGTITAVLNDGLGASIGLKNKEIEIRPDNQPAFTIVLFHCDIISDNIKTGLEVEAGKLLGYGRLYYDDLDKYVTSFDIAVGVNTPSGMRLVSYFDILKDEVFNQYISRGAGSRQDFIISKEERDADPLECNGETFLNSGTIENWINLN